MVELIEEHFTEVFFHLVKQSNSTVTKGLPPLLVNHAMAVSPTRKIGIKEFMCSIALAWGVKHEATLQCINLCHAYLLNTIQFALICLTIKMTAMSPKKILLQW